MRKYLCVLMSIILCLTVFCSCANSQNSTVAESSTVTSTTSSEQVTDAGEVTVTSNEAQTTQKADKEKSKNETTEKGEKASTAAKSASKQGNKKTTAAAKTSTKAQSKKSNSKAKKKYVNEKESAIDSKADKPKTTSSKENDGKVTHTTSSEINCSITIECKSILDNMDDLKKGHESYVPKNGIMLDNYKTTLKSKSTVYDLLKKACKDNNITYTAKETTYSIYIVGINNIDEFDCGKQSGWMYSVNGSYPNVSADSKKLKDGDKVVFTYTCSYKK